MVEQPISPRETRYTRKQLLGIAGGFLGGVFVGGVIDRFLIRSQQPLPTPSLPITGKFVDVHPGDTITADTFAFTVEEQLANGTTLAQLEATLWYAGAIPDTSENPQGGWVVAQVQRPNTTDSGEHTFHISMREPKKGQPPVPDGPFSLSVNAKGRRADGTPGVKEGVPGPIQLMYRRRG